MERQELQEFLYFLTRNKMLTREQQRKIILLLTDERSPALGKARKKDGTSRVHNPQGVVNFLRLFSIDDSLKWYTHEWDKPEPFSIQSLIDNANNNHKKLLKFCFGDENEGVPASLFYHVWNFINPDKTNTILTDQLGRPFDTKWSDVIDWCKNNPGFWPGKYITSQGHSFENDINRFKRTIEFRTDVDTDQTFGFQIRTLIKHTISGAVKLEFSDSFDTLGLDAKLYCNVKALFMGITKLCNWVAAYKNKGDCLVIDLQYENGCYILSLLHKGSSMTGPKSKIDGLSGDFRTIRETLFSVCDLEISGLFNGSNVSIVALDSSCYSIGNSIISPTTINNIQDPLIGVCYKLKLYI